MRALIRNSGETILETYGIPGIEWNTGAPLTDRGWYGGPYTLVSDYVPEDPTDEFTPADASAQDLVVEDAVPDTVVIDGVTYTRTT